MHGDPLSGMVLILIVILYFICAITTFYCLLSGFYLTVNLQRYNIFQYLLDHWRRVFLTMIPLVIIFWFTASYSAVFCKVEYESYSPGSGYYFHKMSLFLPSCGNVGSWSYGKMPPDTVPGLTVSSWTPDSEHVVLKNSLFIYLLGLGFINSWVGNYVLKITLETRKQRAADDTSTKA